MVFYHFVQVLECFLQEKLKSKQFVNSYQKRSYPLSENFLDAD
jgi:hypothetical protein